MKLDKIADNKFIDNFIKGCDMKKLFVILGLFISTVSVFAMDWSEYEMMCFINNKEPNYEEWEYLCTEDATDYGYDNSDLENFLIENEKWEK